MVKGVLSTDDTDFRPIAGPIGAWRVGLGLYTWFDRVQEHLYNQRLSDLPERELERKSPDA
jgi:hypothetical protein